MIKVEHTKTHNILKHEWNVGEGNYKNSSHFKRYENVLVADVELVLVEASGEGNTILVNQLWVKPIQISRTEKPEKDSWVAIIRNYTEYKYERVSPEWIIRQVDWIEEETWVYTKDSSFNHLGRCIGKNVFKILALPEHFSSQQLQDIVDSKLKEGKCLVECEEIYDEETIAKASGFSLKVPVNIQHKIKLNPHITIYNVEEKMYPEKFVNWLIGKQDAERMYQKYLQETKD